MSTEIPTDNLLHRIDDKTELKVNFFVSAKDFSTRNRVTITVAEMKTILNVVYHDIECMKLVDEINYIKEHELKTGGLSPSDSMLEKLTELILKINNIVPDKLKIKLSLFQSFISTTILSQIKLSRK